MNNILSNREYKIVGDWYAPSKKLKEYASVIKVELIDTTSSAGDWTGLFIQKIKDTFYVIPFFQENAYPYSGYRLYTGKVFSSFNCDVTESIWDEIIKEYIDMFWY